MRIFLFFLGLFLCGAFLNAQTLDEVIINAAVKISNELPANTTVAVISFYSNSEGLNNYISSELYGAILRNRKIVPVIAKLDQTQSPNFRDEPRFERITDTNKELIQRAGRLLNVKYLVTGSLERIGSESKINFVAINADNAMIQSHYSSNVTIDNNLLVSFPDSSTPAKNDAEPVKQEQVSATIPDSKNEKKSALLLI